MSISYSQLLSIALLMLVSAVLIITGLKKQPGIGIIVAVVIIIAAMILRKQKLISFGFALPDNWLTTILLGLALGLILQLLSVLLVEPLTEKLTHTTHDHSIINNIEGNWKAFLQWMALVWITVALLEEGIYRGFLMTETATAIGISSIAIIVNIIFSSLVFGLSHGYQNRCGIYSTAIIGLFLACIFVLTGFNLWIAIFTHGFIDTIGIGLIALDWDKKLQQLFWKKSN